MRHSIIAALFAGAAFAGTAWSHSDSHDAKDTPRAISTEEHRFGRQGDPKAITRTVTIDMADSMRYTPAHIVVERGETVRFDVRNSGQVMHEIVLGSMEDLKRHAELMRRHPGMEHDEPYMAHVAPGKRASVVWQFTRGGEFFYGCLVPGHFEAGMVGKVVVR